LKLFEIDFDFRITGFFLVQKSDQRKPFVPEKPTWKSGMRMP
jgi:hypothetical protein